MKSYFPLLTIFFALTTILSAQSLIPTEGRVIFIGDSITGQGSSNGNSGWIGMIGEAIDELHPSTRPTLITLGGSGMTLGSWGGVERNSRTTSIVLDNKEFDVQKELGRHADVIVIMLGMNDVLACQLQDNDAGYDKWIGTYRALIRALRERTTPQVIALAAPTPCTEDPTSPKNVVIDRMAEELKILAAEENCILLPVRDAMWEMLDIGRRMSPEFHVTTDEVHPNVFGHHAIAIGVLRGLGEPAAAELLTNRARGLLSKFRGVSGLSYEINLQPGIDWKDGSVTLRVRAYGVSPTVKVPEGWTVTSVAKEQNMTIFLIKGKPDQLENRFTLYDGNLTREIVFPAPWLVGTANFRTSGWSRGEFDSAKGSFPIDDEVRMGAATFTARADGLELAPGFPVKWKIFMGGINYGGRGAPDVIDFAAIDYFLLGETGYGLRWIKTERERTVNVRVRPMGFASVSHLQLWVNGETIVDNNPLKEREKVTSVTLNAGWNLISFKSSFWQWQWLFSIDLQPAPGDTLNDLRFSLVPPQ